MAVKLNKDFNRKEFEQAMEDFSSYIGHHINFTGQGHRLGKGMYITEEMAKKIRYDMRTQDVPLDDNFKKRLQYGYTDGQAKRLYKLLEVV